MSFDIKKYQEFEHTSNFKTDFYRETFHIFKLTHETYWRQVDDPNLELDNEDILRPLAIICHLAMRIDKLEHEITDLKS